MIRRMLPLLALATIALASPGAAAAQAFPDGVVRKFSGWTVTCDNTHACWAQVFADNYGTAALSLEREAGPEAEFEIEFFGDVESAAFDLPGYEAVFIDAEYASHPDMNAAGYVIAPARTGRFVEAVLKSATLSDSLSTISLAGASAAMSLLDDVQGRSGTVRALVAKGDEPASAVPPIPAMPIISAPITKVHVIEGEPSAALKAAAVAACGGEDYYTEFEAEGARLDDGREIWLMPCSSGMYNFITAGLLKDGDAISELVFTGPKDGTLDTHELWNAHIATGEDGVAGPGTALTLITFDRGRAMGDCGDRTEHVWTGKAFAIVSHSGIDRCVGLSPDTWPRSWQAETKAE